MLRLIARIFLIDPFEVNKIHSSLRDEIFLFFYVQAVNDLPTIKCRYAALSEFIAVLFVDLIFQLRAVMHFVAQQTSQAPEHIHALSPQMKHCG